MGPVSCGLKMEWCSQPWRLVLVYWGRRNTPFTLILVENVWKRRHIYSTDVTVAYFKSLQRLHTESIPITQGQWMPWRPELIFNIDSSHYIWKTHNRFVSVTILWKWDRSHTTLVMKWVQYGPISIVWLCTRKCIWKWMWKWRPSCLGLKVLSYQGIIKPGVRASTTMVLNMLNKWVLVFLEGGFQLTVNVQCREMTENIHVL